MEVFSGDINSMEQDIKYCLEAIPRCNNGKNSYNLYRSLHSLLCFYELLTKDATRYVRKLNKNKDFWDAQAKKSHQLYNNSIEAYIGAKDMNLSFSNALFSDDTEVEFIYEEPNTDELHLDDNEIYEIVDDYLKKYNKSGLELFDEMVKDRRIFYATVNDTNACGYTICNTYMKKNHIVLMVKNNYIKLLSTLVHELGHVYDIHKIYGQQQDITSRYLSISPFIETLAILEEKRFIEFLISEGVDKKRSINNLTNLYQSMFDDLSKITVLSMLPDRLLRHNKYASLSKEDFYNNVPNLMFDFTDDYLEEPYKYSVIDNSRYGYGTAIAIYLDAIRKADKFRYQEKLNKFMSLRTGYLSSDFFDRLGVSIYEMADIVTDEIEATNKNVLIKK